MQRHSVGSSQIAAQHRIVVIGAGIGGLVAGQRLAMAGFAVTIVERAESPGGKMRELAVGSSRLDTGPTVLTMRQVFDELFDDAGASLADHVTLDRLDVLARHAWPGGATLDLHADAGRSAEAIAAFAGPAAAAGYRRFGADARRMVETLDRTFMRASRPGMLDLVRRCGWQGLPGLLAIAPHRTLWSKLGDYFADPRLRQLFGRYATYCGSSPFAAPATLMLIAAVEQAGVWSVRGGMQRLAEALADLSSRSGAALRYGATVTAIEAGAGRVRAVTLASGEKLEADAVVLNADIGAAAAGLFGKAARTAVPALRRGSRSLSAVTFALLGRPLGLEPDRHNVFFSDDYEAEFRAIFRERRVPSEPTVYLCAADRPANGPAMESAERLFLLINAPADGDVHDYDSTEIAACERRTRELLDRCNVRIATAEPARATTPSDFERLFPGTGGALYGAASHGWRASFTRPGSSSRLRGLYLAGGSVHPGAGVPMVALSGRLVADQVTRDLRPPTRVSTGRFRPAAMPGGTSTR